MNITLDVPNDIGAKINQLPNRNEIFKQALQFVLKEQDKTSRKNREQIQIAGYKNTPQTADEIEEWSAEQDWGR